MIQESRVNGGRYDRCEIEKIEYRSNEFIYSNILNRLDESFLDRRNFEFTTTIEMYRQCNQH